MGGYAKIPMWKIVVSEYYTAVLQEQHAATLLQNRILLRKLLIRYFTRSEGGEIVSDLIPLLADKYPLVRVATIHALEQLDPSNFLRLRSGNKALAGK